MSKGQTLADAAKGNRQPIPGATASNKPAPPDAPLYEVVGTGGFFYNRLYTKGELVRYAGKPGKALRLVEEKPQAKDLLPKGKASVTGASPTDKDVL